MLIYVVAINAIILLTNWMNIRSIHIQLKEVIQKLDYIISKLDNK